MAKLMLMTITGGIDGHVVGPYRRFVSVEIPEDFIAAMRVNLIKEVQGLSKAGQLDDDKQADLIKSVRIGLKHTGLADYPETPEAQAELYRRFTQMPKPEEELILA